MKYVRNFLSGALFTFLLIQSSCFGEGIPNNLEDKLSETLPLKMNLEDRSYGCGNATVYRKSADSTEALVVTTKLSDLVPNPTIENEYEFDLEDLPKDLHFITYFWNPNAPASTLAVCNDTVTIADKKPPQSWTATKGNVKIKFVTLPPEFPPSCASGNSYKISVHLEDLNFEPASEDNENEGFQINSIDIDEALIGWCPG